MASRVPGGFGGFYYDDDGTLTVLLVDPSKQAEARAALAREQFVQNRTEAVGRTEFDVQSAETAKAQYPHDQLHAWLDELLHRLRSFAVTPTKSGISVRRNRIVVGVRSKNDRTKARTALDQAGFPEDAVIVELAPPLRLAKTVHDRFRPVPGGVQIVYHNDNKGQYAECTQGPVVVRDPEGDDPENAPQEGYLVPSHCSDNPFHAPHQGYPYEHYWQPVRDASDANHIGNKAIDPNLFACTEDPDGCRNSDAALALYPDYASGELGYIARPSSRNNFSYSLDSSSPRFKIVGTYIPWAISGETMEKVGRSTGWTGGTVVEGCFGHDVGPGEPTIRCTMIVDAEAGDGDSGAPVFSIASGTDVYIRGTLFGFPNPDTSFADPNCTSGPGPLGEDWIRYCEQFVASNLGGINQDLDPDGLAPLTYF